MRDWELDDSGQPAQRILERRRPAQFISQIPKPKKHKSKAAQPSLGLEDERLSTQEQKAVKTTAFDLQVNPAHPGLRFHKLDKPRTPASPRCG